MFSKTMSFVAVIVITVLTTLVAHAFFPGSKDSMGFTGTAALSQKRETTLDRIKRTGVLRCGYIVSPPYLFKDPNTGKMSGPAYDFLQGLARELDVQISWIEEVTYGTFQEGLNTNRYDLTCSPLWQGGVRAKVALLTKPIFYNAMYAFARQGDNRFDQDLDSINRPDVNITVNDGDPGQDVRRTRFPGAKEVAVPQGFDAAQIFFNVATKKADVGFENIGNIQTYNANAKEGAKIKLVAKDQPVRLFANTLAVRLGEAGWKATLDAAIDTLNNDGTTTSILQKYGPSFLPVAPGYLLTAK